MSDAKHTPGPWIVQNPDIFEDEEFKTDAVVGPFEGEQVALVYCDYNKDLANAHLIAAAPEILAALEGMKWFVDHIMGKEKRVDWGKTFDINWMGVNEVLINLEKSLKKAKGDL